MKNVLLFIILFTLTSVMTINYIYASEEKILLNYKTFSKLKKGLISENIINEDFIKMPITATYELTNDVNKSKTIEDKKVQILISKRNLQKLFNDDVITAKTSIPECNKILVQAKKFSKKLYKNKIYSEKKKLEHYLFNTRSDIVKAFFQKECFVINVKKIDIPKLYKENKASTDGLDIAIATISSKKNKNDPYKLNIYNNYEVLAKVYDDHISNNPVECSFRMEKTLLKDFRKITNDIANTISPVIKKNVYATAFAFVLLATDKFYDEKGQERHPGKTMKFDISIEFEPGKVLSGKMIIGYDNLKTKVPTIEFSHATVLTTDLSKNKSRKDKNLE
ncbi:MAG: hypothetical protein HQK49_03470 [Oligoflexia bacterium]|nr:hypothetical protein [Oligoflexia bacterium]